MWSTSRLHILTARNVKKTKCVAMNTSGLELFVCGLSETYWDTCLRCKTIYSGGMTELKREIFCCYSQKNIWTSGEGSNGWVEITE